MRHPSSAILVLCLAAPVAQAAEATPRQLEQRCSDYTISADEQIAACTALLPLYGQDIGKVGVRAVAVLARGAAYARKGDRERAMIDYLDAIRIDSGPLDSGATEPLLFNDRCWARAIAMIDLDKALADCNEALRLRPGFTAALDSRAFLHLRRGAFRDALTDYEAVLKDSPGDAYSLFGRGIAKLRTGDSIGGNVDLMAAQLLQKGVREEFAAYGVTP